MLHGHRCLNEISFSWRMSKDVCSAHFCHLNHFVTAHQFCQFISTVFVNLTTFVNSEVTSFVNNINHLCRYRQYPSSQPELSGTARCILELLCVSNNETYLPGFTKSEVDTMINALKFALVNQLDHFFPYICIAISVSNCTFIVVRINYTHIHTHYFCQQGPTTFVNRNCIAYYYYYYYYYKM